MAEEANTGSNAAGADEEGDSVWMSVRRQLFVGLAVVLVVCGAVRALGYSQVDEKVLYFLAAAGLVLMLERVTEFTVGKDGVSAKLAQQAIQIARANRDIITGAIGGRPAAGGAEAAAALPTHKVPTTDSDEKLLGPVRIPDDPQKGRFGGSETQNNWTLATRRIKVLPGELCRFTVRVSRLSPGMEADEVDFFLHDSFRPQVRTVVVDEGVAELTLIAYGGFTVGALVKRGEEVIAKLELDLAKNTRFPKWFRER